MGSANEAQAGNAFNEQTRQPRPPQSGQLWGPPPWTAPDTHRRHCTPRPPPPFVQTRARFGFRGQKCGNMGSPCLGKPVLQHGRYQGTHVAGIRAGRKLLCGGGGGYGGPFSQPPPLLGRRDGRGGFRAGVPYLPCRGGGSTQHLWLKMIGGHPCHPPPPQSNFQVAQPTPPLKT